MLDASGNEIADSTHIGNLNPFRYRSYYFDTETGLYFLQSRYYDSQIGRFITIDDHTYLDPDTINGVNLYSYCRCNPIAYVDVTGNSAVVLFLLLFATAAILKGDSQQVSDSSIIESDININGNNPNGHITVNISDDNIEIKDSYKYDNTNDMRAILNVIMTHNEYNKFGYNRSLESYLSEWRAHNFAYKMDVFGLFRERTASVNLNRVEKEDSFSWIYGLF